MQIQAVARGPNGAVGYLVFDHQKGDALIVDAPLESTSSFLELIRRSALSVKYLINTHGHWDLIADNVQLVKATGAALCAHAWDSARLANPSIGVESSDRKIPAIKPSRPDIYLNDGDNLDIDGLRFEVMSTPGHTPGSICVHEPIARALFTGDLIGRQIVGSTDHPGGNAATLSASLLKLIALPDETRIFPAHGPATTIREVRWLLDLAKAG